jgi:UDP-glucose 4-epimerase
MSTVLVTGGSGFIGTVLIEKLLSKDYEVINADVTHGPGIWIGGDLAHSHYLGSTMKAYNPKAIIHLAAMHYLPDCEKNPEFVIRDNISALLSVLESIGSLSLDQFIFISSNSVYRSEVHRLTEGHETRPIDLYGITKLTGERMVSVYADLLGFTYKNVRLFNVYGPGDTHDHLIPAIARQVKEGATDIFLGNTKSVRDFTYVDDVVDAIILLLEKESSSTTVNVGSGLPHSAEDLVFLFGEIVGRQLQCKSTNIQRVVDPNCLVADILKMKTRFGWNPKVKIEEGLRKVLGGTI